VIKTTRTNSKHNTNKQPLYNYLTTKAAKSSHTQSANHTNGPPNTHETHVKMLRITQAPGSLKLSKLKDAENNVFVEIINHF